GRADRVQPEAGDAPGVVADRDREVVLAVLDLGQHRTRETGELDAPLERWGVGDGRGCCARVLAHRDTAADSARRARVAGQRAGIRAVVPWRGARELLSRSPPRGVAGDRRSAATPPSAGRYRAPAARTPRWPRHP